MKKFYKFKLEYKIDSSKFKIDANNFIDFENLLKDIFYTTDLKTKITYDKLKDEVIDPVHKA